MPRYRQPQLPGLPLFIPRRKGKTKRAVRTGGKTYKAKDAPQGIHILGVQVSTAKLARARRRA